VSSRVNKSAIAGIAIIVALLAVSIVFVLIEGPGAPPATSLGTVEISEYEGQPLSPIKGVVVNAVSGVPKIDAGAYRLVVDGLVAAPASYTYNDILTRFPAYSKVVRITCVDGWSADILWRGLLVRDILAESGVSPEGKIIIFYASDGYTTSFPIEYLTGNDIIMAYGMNDVAIPTDHGFPFQLVAESKWGYKWIKWIDRIEVSDNTSYRGFWESRGYSNSGDLSGNKFER
jgi:DMSO/TMAO reductase YedYZ molybdopterin-dependent catalytic subunit